MTLCGFQTLIGEAYVSVFVFQKKEKKKRMSNCITLLKRVCCV